MVRVKESGLPVGTFGLLRLRGRGVPPQARHQYKKSLHGFFGSGAWVVCAGDPQRCAQQRPAYQVGRRQGIDGAYDCLLDQLLEAAARIHDAHVLAGPLGGIAQNRWPVQQDDPLDFGLDGHLDVANALLNEAVPGGLRLLDDDGQSARYLCINLGDDRLQQPFLSTEVVIERSARQSGLGRQLIH